MQLSGMTYLFKHFMMACTKYLWMKNLSKPQKARLTKPNNFFYYDLDMYQYNTFSFICQYRCETNTELKSMKHYSKKVRLTFEVTWNQ